MREKKEIFFERTLDKERGDEVSSENLRMRGKPLRRRGAAWRLPRYLAEGPRPQGAGIREGERRQSRLTGFAEEGSRL
jgi:hypothetical protein